MKPLVGIGMVGMGAVMVFGGITGRLAPMLAALFAPSALTEKSGGSSWWNNILPDLLLPGAGGLLPKSGLIPGVDVPVLPFISQPLTPQQPPVVNPFLKPGAVEVVA